MSNPYIVKVEKMLSSKDIEMKWSTVDQAKRYIANIQQLQKEIRLVKSEVTLAKQQILTSYASAKVHVGKGFGAGVATGLFGAKTVGRANAVTRNNLRHKELKALEPYVEAEHFIAKVLTGLDSLKLEMKTWLAAQNLSNVAQR